jgi:hypothetical protein
MMNKIRMLLSLFSKEQLRQLSNECKKQENLVSRFVLILIRNEKDSEKEIQQQLKISTNTFNKINSQVKDFLFDALGKNVETSFDGIYVIQKIIFSGEIDFARKLVNEKEKEFEQKQLWMHLEVLYVEASRIFYNTGSLSESLKLAEKRNKNSKRLAAYINLNSGIINEMIRLEGFKNRKPDTRVYQKKLIAIKKEAYKLGHHVLIHNALHLNYLFISRYFQNAGAVHEIILEMQGNKRKFEFAMHPFSKAIINNTHLNFLTIYNGFGNPEQFAGKWKKGIYAAGKVAGANMCYAILEFYLYEKNIPKVMEWMKELEKIEDNSKFRQYKHIILAIKAFIENDDRLFKKHFSEFYNDRSHLDFPDMEVNLRIIELLILSQGRDDYLVESKISALRKYMSRNINKDRYHEEKKLLLLIEKSASGKTASIVTELNLLLRSRYRNIVFLAEKMKSGLLKVS